MCKFKSSNTCSVLASEGKSTDGGLCVSGCFMHVFLSFHNACERTQAVGFLSEH